MKIQDPAFNYDKYGQQYSGQRQTEPKIAKLINEALGEANTILNIGAGAGSYEPENRYVIAVEPSVTMRSQRIQNGKTPAINATAEKLPFDDQSFDAATAFLTIHHWPDIAKGLSEVRRVTRGKIVIMSYDKDDLDVFWNAKYFPEVVDVERQRYPDIQWLCNALGDECEIKKVPVPLNCIDGFQEAFYGRPEGFLATEVSSAMSAWGFIPGKQQEIMVSRFRETLASGEWDQKYGHLRQQPFFTGALRLIIAKP